MDARFKKVKRKFLLFSLVKSLICAISAGFFAVGVVLLALKLAGIPIRVGYYVLIGVGAAAICFAAVFPFLRPDDLTVARKIDKEHALRERVETMIAFADDGGDVARLQREDAKSKIESLPKKKPVFKKLWQYILIPVSALALFIPAVAVKGGYRGNTGRQPQNYAVTEWQLSSLKEIILNVEESELSDGLKNGAAAALDGFYGSLENGIPVDTFNAVFLSTVKLVDGILSSESTYREICSRLVTDEAYEPLSDVIVSSVKAYRQTAKISSYDAVKSRAADLEADVDAQCRTYLLDGEESLLKSFTAVSQNDGLMQLLNGYKDGLDGLLKKTETAEDDGLYVGLSNFVSGIAEVAALEGRADGYVYEKLQTHAFKPLADSMPHFLYLQSYNYLLDEYVRERLAAVFYYPSSGLPLINLDVEKPNGGEENPEDPGDETGEGGKAPGEMKYGSDDIIYDPERNAYVSYGEVINEYYSRVLGQIIEGGVSEDRANILTSYFDMLMSGIGQKDDDKNN